MPSKTTQAVSVTMSWRPASERRQNAVLIHGATAVMEPREQDSLPRQIAAASRRMFQMAAAQSASPESLQSVTAFIRHDDGALAALELLRSDAAMRRARVRVYQVPTLGRGWMRVQLNAVFSSPG